MDIDNTVELYKERLIESVKKLVKVRSVEGKHTYGEPFGNGPRMALECALSIAEELGFKTVNIDNYIGYAEYGEGEDYVGVLGHVDIVPEGDGWIYPPFAGEVHDDKIYGRGTVDDKGPIIAALYGMYAIRELKLPISKKIRIIFGTNEESGCGEIVHYLEKEKPPICGFTPDGQFPIINGEKGITNINAIKELKNKGDNKTYIKYIKGGQRENMVPDYCEACIITNNKEQIIKSISEISNKHKFDIRTNEEESNIIVKSYGIAAHGSLPELGKNAIMQLFYVIGQLGFNKSDIIDFIDFFNKNAGFETDGKSFGVYMEDDVSGKLSFNIGTVNSTENEIVMGLNLRYPVKKTYEEMIEKLKMKLEGTRIKIDVTLHEKPLYFDPKHPLIKVLQNIYTKKTGKEAELLVIGGGTYAKEMPNIVAFGPIFPGKPDLDHQANECMEIEDLILSCKIYANAMYELAK